MYQSHCISIAFCLIWKEMKFNLNEAHEVYENNDISNPETIILIKKLVI